MILLLRGFVIKTCCKAEGTTGPECFRGAAGGAAPRRARVFWVAGGKRGSESPNRKELRTWLLAIRIQEPSVFPWTCSVAQLLCLVRSSSCLENAVGAPSQPPSPPEGAFPQFLPRVGTTGSQSPPPHTAARSSSDHDAWGLLWLLLALARPLSPHSERQTPQEIRAEASDELAVRYCNCCFHTRRSGAAHWCLAVPGSNPALTAFSGRGFGASQWALLFVALEMGVVAVPTAQGPGRDWSR